MKIVPATLAAFVAATTMYGAILSLPPDLNPGDKYRLVFVTDGIRDASSAKIGNYDAFVTGEAEAVQALFDLQVSWSVIGSIQSVSGIWNAHDHTGTNPLLGEGLPIYRLDGTRVASNNSDFWDGALNAPISITPSGVFLSESQFVWTGTNPDGSSSDRWIGTNPVTSPTGDTSYGFATATDGQWTLAGSAANTLHSYRLYGISGELTVIPEPSLMFLIPAGMIFLMRRNRHHRNTVLIG